MASERARRDNTTDERDVHLEVDRVPKMTIHFENLSAENPKDSDSSSATIVVRGDQQEKARESNKMETQFESLADKVKEMDAASLDKEQSRRNYQQEDGGKSRGRNLVGKFEMGDEEEKERAGEEEQGGGENKQQLSLEEISKLRQTAQQNSAEAIKAAQERYKAAKEKASQGLVVADEYAKEKGEQTKDTVVGAAQKTSQLIADKGAQAKDAVKEKGAQAKETVVKGAQMTSQLIAEKGAQAKDTVKEKGAHAKDTVLEGAERTTEYAAERGGQATDALKEKGSQPKDTVLEGAQKTSQQIAEKSSQAKDTILEKGSHAKEMIVEGAQKTSHYAVEKADAAKEKTLETGKDAAHYSGEVAIDVKDKVAVAGWTAAHYTTEKTVEGTKSAARAVQGVTEKAAEIAAKPFSAAKQAAVATGESMKEYTARKKEEAEREWEERNAKKRVGQTEVTQRQTENLFPEVAEVQREEHGEWQQQQEGGGVFSAIGETIAEIAQTTKEIVIGQDQPRAQGSAMYDQESQTHHQYIKKEHDEN